MVMAPGVQPTYEGRIAEFVAYYMVGDSGSPKAFGGRANAVEKLDSWLSDYSSPRRQLLTGPAGRGKSALLLRWCESTQRRIATAFVPISIRFGTSEAQVFYTLLAARLAHLINLALPSIGSDVAGSYAEFCAQTLDAMEFENRQLLIVVDGLDEAVGWRIDVDLFRRRRRNVRILVSARAMLGEPEQRQGEKWVKRLGWRLDEDASILELEPLDAAGITSIVRDAGFDVYDDDALPRELVRLSQGDPLLLGYLVEDLQKYPELDSQSIVRKLNGYSAGFSEYFSDWIERQRPIWLESGREAPTFDATLALLSCAIGPLALGDIESLLARMGRPPCAVEQPLRDMARFVLRVEGGFVLSHPRLADHLRSQHFRDGALIALARTAIVDWGIETLDALGRDSGIDAPRYLVRFLVQHMIGAKLAPSTVMRTLEFGWLCACERAEGGFLAYATQLRVAGNYAAQHASSNNPSHGWFVAVSVVLNSIRNSATVPPGFLAACVKEGVLGADRALMQLAYSNPEERVRGTVALLPYIPAAQQASRIDECIALAETAPDRRGRLRARADAINAVSRGPRRDALESALLDDAFGGQGSMYEWIVALEAVATTMTGPRLLRLIEIGIAQGGKDRWRYVNFVLEHLDEKAMSYAWKRILERHACHTRERTSLGISGDALASLFRFLPGEAKRELWPEALAAARGVQSASDRARALVGVQPNVMDSERAGVDVELLAAAEKSDGTTNGYVLSLADVALNATGEIAQRALELAGECAISELRTCCRLDQLSPILPDALLVRAYEAAIDSELGRVRNEALEVLAPRLSRDQLDAALSKIAEFGDRPAVLAAQAVSASWVGRDDVTLTAINKFFGETQRYSDKSRYLFLADFLAGSAYPLVTNLLQLVQRDGWEAWLERAIDPSNGAPLAWRRDLVRLILNGAFPPKAVAAIAWHLPDDFCTAALDYVESETLTKASPDSYLALVLSAIASRLGRHATRAQKLFEVIEPLIVDTHWPRVAVGISPIVDPERAMSLRAHALQVGMARVALQHELLEPLLELGADPDSLVTEFLRYSLDSAHFRHLEVLVSRLQEAPLTRLLQALFGSDFVKSRMGREDETHRLVVGAWLKRRIANSEHASREDLLLVVKELMDSLYEVDGAAGAEAVRVALETVSRRFP